MKKGAVLLLIIPLLLLTLDHLGSPVFAAEDVSLNPTVPNVYDQFMALKHHGEALGFWLGDAPEPSDWAHYQGIQRSLNLGTPYFFVSRSGRFKDVDPIWSPGNLHVVEMKSRDGSGERLRSNRLQEGRYTLETTPPDSDKIVHTITFNGQNGWPAYAHVGGMQIVGSILAAPLEDPHYEDSQPKGMVVFVNVASPTTPSYLGGISFEHPAGAVAITQQPDGKLLMLVLGGDGERIHVFTSNAAIDLQDPNLSDGFSQIDTWTPDEIGTWYTGNDMYQSINFVRKSDGTLFLIGTRNTTPPDFGGEDWAELYIVLFTEEGEFKLGRLASRQFWCSDDGAGLIGHFRAAAAFYVSPSGELILYTTPHTNCGPNGFAPMGEFRHMYVNRPESPLRRPTADAGGPYVVAEGSSIELSGEASRPPIGKPWVELYEDADFKGRSLVLDWEDQYKDDFHNLDEHDIFDNKASSVLWQAPVGCDIKLYEDPDYKGHSQRLVGAGVVVGIANLGWDAYEFDNKASSIKFDDWGGTGEGQHLDFAWDLDLDGLFDEQLGVTAEFSAASLNDGVYGANLLVDGAYSRPDLDQPGWDIEGTTVTVFNVPPTATIDSLIQPNPHFILPIVHTLIFTGSFTDPGALDVHAANWDFGDGTVIPGTLVEEHNAPDATGNVTASHAYSNPGTYTVTLTVIDDAGGAGTDTMQVTVLSAEEAREVLRQYILGLADSAFKDNPSQRKKAFSNMFAAISDMLADEEWNGAINALTNDIRAKADGFVDGTPKNDWIRDRIAQQEICLMSDDIVAYLKTFL